VSRGIRKDKGKKELEITRPFWTSNQSIYILWKGFTVQHCVSWEGGICDLTNQAIFPVHVAGVELELGHLPEMFMCWDLMERILVF
jgi:hypothetical protein